MIEIKHVARRDGLLDFFENVKRLDCVIRLFVVDKGCKMLGDLLNDNMLVVELVGINTRTVQFKWIQCRYSTKPDIPASIARSVIINDRTQLNE